MTRSRALSALTALSSLIAVASFDATASARTSFDPSTGTLVLPRDADVLRSVDFETPESVLGLSYGRWNMNDRDVSFVKTPVNDAAQVASILTAGGEDAVEGSHAIRLGANGRGLVLDDPALFAALRDARFEVSLWARTNGPSPELRVVYDRDPNGIGLQSFAAVRGVRTGRETSDGWAEFVVGPLDGTVWGVSPIAILISPSAFSRATGEFLLDALEVRRVAGAPTAPLACTAQNVDAVCGAEGDCMFGHCVSSTVTWGMLPAPAHRVEIAERWVHFATRVIGDRKAAEIGRTFFAPNARALATGAASSRQFFGGLNRLVNLLRDNHTSFGQPSNFSSFAPLLQGGSSSTLGACFGVVEKDIAGGGRGYAVFRATEKPLSGTPLKRGDLLVAIDGRDPKEWVDDVWPRYVSALPNDPDADWGPSANDLSRLITTRASKVTFARCASATACDAGSREIIDVDVSDAIYGALVGTFPEDTSPSVSCSQRFTNTVEGAPSRGGEDPVNSTVGEDGTTRVQFDGFVGQSSWKSAWTKVFETNPAKVLVDARMGHGGYLDAVDHLLGLLRSKSDPMGVVMLGRAGYAQEDATWLFGRASSCALGVTSRTQWLCYQSNASGVFADVEAPTGVGSRIAWLNTYDVSANDFMPRLLQGRAGFRIFAPHPTAGAFGAIASTPGVFTNWSGGSLQIQDSRFGTTLTAAEAARWESGHGVVPDEIVTEKLSDAILGVDTIVTAANAWLAAE